MIVTPWCRCRAVLFATLLMTAVGCAGNQAFSQADLEMQRGNLDTAIAYYQEMLIEDPGNTEASIKLSLCIWTHLKDWNNFQKKLYWMRRHPIISTCDSPKTKLVIFTILFISNAQSQIACKFTLTGLRENCPVMP